MTPAETEIREALATDDPLLHTLFVGKADLAELLAELDRLRAERKPLTEEQAVACLVEAGCVGTVKMSYDSGPYEITRTSINADRLIRAVERAHGITGD